MKWDHGPPVVHEPAGSSSWWRWFMRVLLASFVVALTPVAIHAGEETAAKPYWIDPATKLMWTTADNGAGASWSQAARYCRDLKTGGFKDWKLPGISDLQSLFGGPVDTRGYHIKGPIRLTGWQWSATPGERAGEGWVLDFGDGARASVAAGDSGLNRALCVRYPPAAATAK